MTKTDEEDRGLSPWDVLWGFLASFCVAVALLGTCVGVVAAFVFGVRCAWRAAG